MILEHARQMLCLWRERFDPNPWINLEYRQAYRDALESMKRCHLIDDYGLTKGINIKNVWYYTEKPKNERN